MPRKTINGYAVVRKDSLSRSFEVCGIGQDTPAAWKDAAEIHTHGRLDAREMIAQNPHMKCVEAKITITFDQPRKEAP